MSLADWLNAASISATAGATSALVAGWAILEGRRLRSLQTDPHVIVYLDQYRPGSQVFSLVVENIGSGPAHLIDLSFPSRPVRFELWAKQHNDMYILKHGIQFLAPGQSRHFPIGSMVAIDKSDFSVAVHYYKSRVKYSKNAVSDLFILRMNEYLGTPVETDASVEAIKAISKQVKELRNSLDRLRREGIPILPSPDHRLASDGEIFLDPHPDPDDTASPGA